MRNKLSSRYLIAVGIVLLFCTLTPVIAQAPTGGSLWTYYLKDNRWVWGEIRLEAPSLRLDTSGTVARLIVDLPPPVPIRETTEIAVVSETDAHPYVRTLANDPVSESLMVIVNGFCVEAGLDYSLEGRTITFTQTATPGYPSPGSRIQFRYRY